LTNEVVNEQSRKIGKLENKKNLESCGEKR
jgi:hypothetical protein